MLEPIHLEATEDTPKVILDKAENVLEISGRSLPEDATEFFSPIQNWIADYVKDPNETTELHLKLEYFNSSSASKIVKVLILLEALFKEGKNAKAVWHYEENDDLMQARGKELSVVIDLPFEIVTYND